MTARSSRTRRFEISASGAPEVPRSTDRPHVRGIFMSLLKPLRTGRIWPKLVLLAAAFAVLAVAITRQPPKMLRDFDQPFYITIAYDLEHDGVFSNGIFNRTEGDKA